MVYHYKYIWNDFYSKRKQNSAVSQTLRRSANRKTGLHCVFFNRKGRCAIDDEMREILEQMLSADLLLFSFPFHSYGMPAGLKNLVDRMLPLSSMAMTEANGRYVHAGQRDYSHLKFLMICGCGFPNSRRNFEPAVRQYAEAGQIDAALLKKIGSPMIPEETYAAIVNGSV